MEALNGNWVMEKSLSTGVDAIFKLQGVSWPLRKALSLATGYTDISVHPQNEETDLAGTVIESTQTATGGLAGAQERRVLDWAPEDHKDYVFGRVQNQNRAVFGSDGPCPELEVQLETSDEKVKKFLRGEVLEDGSASAGFVLEGPSEKRRDVWVHAVGRNDDNGWTSEQVWGFEEINGQRCHTRRVVVMNKKGQIAMARIVFSRYTK
ncbi:hypothetical protein BJX61DRAFT_546496 [Aspergillus egyptiacus]|nr:hypothetical protein BJX61DRAFT_546496 [Aspergillus egyptiacus]